jgi:hypothetical protein
MLPLSGQVSGHSTAPIPDECFLLPGWAIKTSTIGIGANSQWQAITLWLAESG